MVTPLALLASVPLGAIVSGVLVVNNLRDIDTDRAAGKRTLAARWGPAGARREYAALLALAYLTPLVGWLTGVMPVWALLAWLSAPVALSLARRLWTTNGRALNPLLSETARLAVLFAVPFAIGLLL
jgi:1,4-dihydroxy-2-naphthoate octaprenyltransferase